MQRHVCQIYRCTLSRSRGGQVDVSKISRNTLHLPTSGILPCGVVVTWAVLVGMEVDVEVTVVCGRDVLSVHITGYI